MRIGLVSDSKTVRPPARGSSQAMKKHAPDVLVFAGEVLACPFSPDPPDETIALLRAEDVQTISRPPVRPLDLALEDAQLVPEGQELEPDAGVRASAIDEASSTEDEIEESEKHDRASWQVGSSRSAGLAGTASGVS